MYCSQCFLFRLGDTWAQMTTNYDQLYFIRLPSNQKMENILRNYKKNAR